MAEANKEQAEESARRGIEALNNGDAPTAVRLLTKALRMYSNLGPQVEKQLDKAKRIVEGKDSEDNNNNNNDYSPRTPTSSSTNSNHTNGDGVRHRHVHSSSSSTTTTSSTTTSNPVLRPHTPEMAELVRKIKNAKTYYDVLGVPSDADEDAIKKAYKKLALKIHPDKNTAPGSDEAFKRVGAACAVLTDANKRAAYDRYGEAGADGISNNSSSDREQARARYYRQHFEEEISPEDIFNMFFNGGLGGGFGGGMTQIYRDEDGNLRAVRTPNRVHRHENANGWDDRWYSLRKTDTYSQLRKTYSELEYYVRPETGRRLSHDVDLLRKIDFEVHRDWAKACRQDTTLPSCKKLFEQNTGRTQKPKSSSSNREESEFNI